MTAKHPDEFRRTRRVKLTPQKTRRSRLVWLVAGVVPVAALIAAAALQFDLGVGPARAEAHAVSPADDGDHGSDQSAKPAPLHNTVTDDPTAEAESIHP